MVDQIVNHLATHAFKTLFIDALGWDDASGTVRLEADDHTFSHTRIAHKRGLQVFHCGAHQYTMFNRRRLRTLQKQLLRLAHEHIVIYSCDQPRPRQVWQWAVRLTNGRRLKHREHPFFSSSPPQMLVHRLQGMRFTLQEEEHATLLDAIDRVRVALDADAEINLFVNSPAYAERSDRLAIAMQSGGVEAFREFVEFHLPMAAWGARKWKQYFGDLDDEDRGQIAVIGLLQAAKRFDQTKGFQFSTYAYHWVRQACQRHGPPCDALIRIPPHILRECAQIKAQVRRLTIAGDDTALRRFIEGLKRSPRLAEYWRRISRVADVRSISDPAEREFHMARRIVAEDDGTSDQGREEVADVIRAAVASLDPDDAEMVRLRYGLDGGEAQTLDQIGTVFRLTKERIRQRIKHAQAQLQADLAEQLGMALPPTRSEEDASDDAEEANAAGATPNGSQSGIEKRVLAAIAAHPTGIDAVALASRLTLDRTVRKAALRSLLDTGQILKKGAGRRAIYRLAKRSKLTTSAPANTHQLILFSDAD